MSLRYGLRARFAVLVGVVAVITLCLVAMMLHRQSVMQREVLTLSQQSMHSLASKRLLDRGKAVSSEAAQSLVNPLYYFDLDAMGAYLRSILRLPDVSYALVYDNEGRIIHDGSEDIAVYGQVMSDPMAFELTTITDTHVQVGDDMLDIAAPLWIGDERLGGVRVGYSLQSVRADEDAVSSQMLEHLQRLGNRHLAGVALLLVGVAMLIFASGLELKRALVAPIRQLADAARAIEGGNYDVEVPQNRRNDEIGDLVRAFSHMRDSVQRHDRDIRRMAYTDALTGLSNRLLFRENLDRQVAEAGANGQLLALLFTDIDDFKRINDTIGHDAGDEVLAQLAARMRDAIHGLGEAAANIELARFGGDEFVVLVRGANSASDIRAEASALAELLVAELGRPITVQGRQLFMGISIGITLFPEDASDTTTLMKNGDIAMYQAKNAGKNCFRFYSRAMDHAAERRMRLEQDLRGAWARGELSLVYQPVYRVADRKLIGAEALLRWNHPEHGAVPPSLFIDVAEQSGLIEVIGPQVLRAACQDAQRWQESRADGEPLFVSVNVSPRQLRSGDLSTLVESVLLETGLAPARLHIELTETAVISDEARVSVLLARLRSAGVKVWLDDFGTGFSGLSHLRRMPIDGVKIDRSFVADVLRDPDDLALTTAIIAMAHSLGIHVVAEGVEKEGQYALLRERGCDMAQGYWLGHPMSLKEFTAQIG